MSRVILLVDDNEQIRHVFVRVLENAGYRVHGAGDLETCISELNQDIPDLILLDIMMTPVDGWGILKKIRSNPVSSTIPVYMFSGKVLMFEDIVKYGTLIDGFIKKPFVNSFLISTLEEFFIWYEDLLTRCNRSLQMGHDKEDISTYITLKRQERSIKNLDSLFRSQFGQIQNVDNLHYVNDFTSKIEAEINVLEEKIQIIEAGIFSPDVSS
jgi:two-component system, OmpR family, response regulator